MSKERSTTRSVESQINVIRFISIMETLVSIIIVISQTVAIGASYEYATRSLTGIWTSWFFFMAAGLALFWSSRCTFNGLLTVLILQIVAATMSIPLFTACCILIGVYDFHWTANSESENALIGSSITILTTNLIMIFASVLEMVLNSYNAYNCYFLAYGGQQKDQYDRQSISSAAEGNREEAEPEPDEKTNSRAPNNAAELNLSTMDIGVIKYCGYTGVVLAVLIFSCQIAMYIIAESNGISIGIGIWGALYYAAAGIVSIYGGYRPSSQSTVSIFILQILQFVLSIPLMGIAFYIVAVFGSCVQQHPRSECAPGPHYGGDLAVSIMGGVMSLTGMVQAMISLVLILVCSQTICGVRCMVRT